MVNRKLWCVKVAYCYPDESYKDTLETDVKLFANEDAAVRHLEYVIRQDWTAEIDGGVPLASCRGRSETSSVKHSAWHYSEDGKLAWMYHSDGHGYKGEVCEVSVPEDAP